MCLFVWVTCTDSIQTVAVVEVIDWSFIAHTFRAGASLTHTHARLHGTMANAGAHTRQCATPALGAAVFYRARVCRPFAARARCQPPPPPPAKADSARTLCSRRCACTKRTSRSGTAAAGGCPVARRAPVRLLHICEHNFGAPTVCARVNVTSVLLLVRSCARYFLSKLR